MKQPASKTFTLDGASVFPTEQIQRIIAAAREGKSVLELMVYDGSDNGEKVYNTLSVIGQPIPGDRTIAAPDPSTANDVMKSLTRWPVTVSYYDRDAKARDGEQTPVYADHGEEFLMESVLDGKVVRGKIPLQRFAETRRTAEPDAGLAPFGHRGPDAVAGQPSVAGVDEDVQADVRGSGVGRQLAEGFLVDIGGGVEQVDAGWARRSGFARRSHARVLHARR